MPIISITFFNRSKLEFAEKGQLCRKDADNKKSLLSDWKGLNFKLAQGI